MILILGPVIPCSTGSCCLNGEWYREKGKQKRSSSLVAVFLFDAEGTSPGVAVGVVGPGRTVSSLSDMVVKEENLCIENSYGCIRRTNAASANT